MKYDTTLEEMMTRAAKLADDAVTAAENEWPETAAAAIQTGEQWMMTSAICERLEETNRLLEKLVEGGTDPDAI